MTIYCPKCLSNLVDEIYTGGFQCRKCNKKFKKEEASKNGRDDWHKNPRNVWR